MELLWKEYAHLYSFFNPPSLNKLHQIVSSNLYGRILDNGCGVGKLTNHINKCEMYLGVDKNRYMIKKAIENHHAPSTYNFLVGDVANPPFPENYFDSCACINVLYSLETFEKISYTLENIQRCLKPGGEFLVTNLTPSLKPEKLEKLIEEECYSTTNDEESKNMLNRFIEINKVLSSEAINYSPHLFFPEEFISLLNKRGFSLKSPPKYIFRNMGILIHMRNSF